MQRQSCNMITSRHIYIILHFEGNRNADVAQNELSVTPLFKSFGAQLEETGNQMAAEKNP